MAPEKSTFTPVIRYFEPCSTSDGYAKVRLTLLCALTIFDPSWVAVTEAICFFPVTPAARFEVETNTPWAAVERLTTNPVLR